jgi:hypothetical protein
MPFPIFPILLMNGSGKPASSIEHTMNQSNTINKLILVPLLVPLLVISNNNVNINPLPFLPFLPNASPLPNTNLLSSKKPLTLFNIETRPAPPATPVEAKAIGLQNVPLLPNPQHLQQCLNEYNLPEKGFSMLTSLSHSLRSIRTPHISFLRTLSQPLHMSSPPLTVSILYLNLLENHSRLP